MVSAVEIGRLLKEAKSLVKHGEWGKWQEESASYSHRTAGRLIQLYEEYGLNNSDGQSSSNWSLVTNLNYTQALIIEQYTMVL
nr:DUF3102 domain-containing protein [Desulfosporosinus sp. OT]